MNNKISLLIVDDDKNYVKELTEYARTRNDFLDVSYAQNGKEALELVKMLQPDVIITDVFMPVLDGIGFLKQLSHIPLKTRPRIIISSVSPLTPMLERASKYGVDYFMMKPQPYSEICDTVCDLFSDVSIKTAEEIVSTKNTEEIISVYMKQLGFSAHLIGFNYMRESLMLAVNDMNVLSPITRNLYPVIAKNNNTSSGCVERALRHAIGFAWPRGNKKLLNDIFGYSPDDVGHDRPTNSEFIAMLADDLQLRLRYDMARL